MDVAMEYSKKRIGPRPGPCGTTDMTDEVDDVDATQWTDCVHPVRCHWNHMTTFSYH